MTSRVENGGRRAGVLFPGRHRRRPLSSLCGPVSVSGRLMPVLSADYDQPSRSLITHCYQPAVNMAAVTERAGGERSPAADKQSARFINIAPGHNLDAARLMEGAAAEFTTFCSDPMLPCVRLAHGSVPGGIGKGC